MKVHLRKKKKSNSGKLSLFIEVYKGQFKDEIGKIKNERDYLFLDLYIFEKPKTKDEKGIMQSLDSVYNAFQQKDAKSYATDFNTNFVAKLHNGLKIDDSNFTMRYQNFVLRFMEPVDLFKNLIIAFISADSSPLMAGVNIVSPEDGETSMKDF